MQTDYFSSATLTAMAELKKNLKRMIDERNRNEKKIAFASLKTAPTK